MKRVSIWGGGITGLAAAYELERISDAEITLYDAAPRLGGKLQTERIGTLLVESGPDCFFARKPGVMEFVRELGLESELVAPERKEFMMAVHDRLYPVPRGLVNFFDVQAEAVETTAFLTESGKRRALDERNQPRGGSEDESIRSFFDRRFGEEFTRLVVEPLLAGTYGGDPARLSMRALYPGYLDAERRHGSLAAAGTRMPKGDPDSPAFLSFRGGMRTLVDGLARGLNRTRISLGSSFSILDVSDRWLIALPANQAAKAFPGIGLEGIRHRTARIVTNACRRDEIREPLEGTGFLVPPSLPGSLNGATWSSQKWPGRAPDDTVLMRVFTREEPGGFGQLDALIGYEGLGRFNRVDDWVQAQPQYEVGHLDRLARIEAQLPPNVWLAGTSYRGVGVPDCLRQGREAARRISETL